MTNSLNKQIEALRKELAIVFEKVIELLDHLEKLESGWRE